MAAESVSRWASWRDFFAATRELTIVIAVAMLLVAPASVRAILERAGIRSVAGIEFDIDAVAESQVALEAAEQELSEVRTQLVALQQTVDRPMLGSSRSRRSAATSATSEPSYDPADQVVSKAVRKMLATVDQAAEDMAEARSTNDDVVNQVQRTVGGESFSQAIQQARERRPNLKPDVSRLNEMRTINQPELNRPLQPASRLGLRSLPVNAAQDR